jgi:hypothetical protein
MLVNPFHCWSSDFKHPKGLIVSKVINDLYSCMCADEHVMRCFLRRTDAQPVYFLFLIDDGRLSILYDQSCETS